MPDAANPGMEPGKNTGFTRSYINQLINFFAVPARRKVLFKYLSSRKPDVPYLLNSDILPDGLRWILDDICVLLSGYDFNQMGFSGTNSFLVEGEQLQWEKYFFTPYYDNQSEYNQVIELLQREGIFSPSFNTHKKAVGLKGD